MSWNNKEEIETTCTVQQRSHFYCYACFVNASWL